MPILSVIGRKDPRVRALIFGIYVLLVAGGLTMVYPFLLMISGSMKSASDVRELDVVPRFLYEDTALYRRYMEALFNEGLDAYRSAYDRDDAAFERVEPPAEPNRESVRIWLDFLDEADLPSHAVMLGFVQARASRTVLWNLREFKREMMRAYGNDVHAMNRALGTEFVSWNAFFVQAENYYSRFRNVTDDPFQRAFREFKARQPAWQHVYLSLNGFYKNQYLKSQFTRDIEEYNAAHGTDYPSYEDVWLSRRAPPQGPERDTWEIFVRNVLNLQWIRVDPSDAPNYRAYLAARYRDIDVLNRLYGTQYTCFDEVQMVDVPPFDGLVLSDWEAFLRGWQDPDTGAEFTAATEALLLQGTDFKFQEYLRERFGDIASLNATCGTSWRSFQEVPMPQRDAHYLDFLDVRRPLRVEFASCNYRTVLDFLLFHGRGLMNTAIYCALAVLLALLVNPMAAYAMSRYKMPTTYKILLFLLLTMAFPPIVTSIPVFLMLRDFNMLNTFFALVLPGMAHGYSIFLLKGFFDSLPRELYESASMDGAGEWHMFWTVTMSLSKPILAVIALNAFTQAYSNFMFALLICQDERMWTLMVWLYQLQMRSGQAVMYASLILAAIPTFLIFFFCQNIILRGIVVPVEK